MWHRGLRRWVRRAPLRVRSLGRHGVRPGDSLPLLEEEGLAALMRELQELRAALERTNRLFRGAPRFARFRAAEIEATGWAERRSDWAEGTPGAPRRGDEKIGAGRKWNHVCWHHPRTRQCRGVRGPVVLARVRAADHGSRLGRNKGGGDGLWITRARSAT